MMSCLDSLSYAEAIGLIGMLTGLISVVFTAYGKYQDSKLRASEIELKKEQFFAEKRHQISQSKRQQLFQEKIDAYLELQIILNELKVNLYSIGQMHEIQWNGFVEFKETSKSGVHTKSLTSIFSIIVDHYFVISEDIIEKYQCLYDLYKKSTEQIDFLDSMGAMDPPDIQSAYDSNMVRFFEEYQENIHSFFNVIDSEIKQLKKDLDI